MERGWLRPIAGSLIVTALVVGLLVLSVQFGAPSWPFLEPGVLDAPLLVVLAAQLLGAAGEEVGWRGLVQPLLETRTTIWRASIITGFLFGLGHFPILGIGVTAYAVFVASSIAVSILLGLATTGRSRLQRVAIATLLHWLINSALLIGFSDGDESLAWITQSAVAVSVVALACVALHRNAIRLFGEPAAEI